MFAGKALPSATAEELIQWLCLFIACLSPQSTLTPVMCREHNSVPCRINIAETLLPWVFLLNSPYFPFLLDLPIVFTCPYTVDLTVREVKKSKAFCPFHVGKPWLCTVIFPTARYFRARERKGGLVTASQDFTSGFWNAKTILCCTG